MSLYTCNQKDVHVISKSMCVSRVDSQAGKLFQLTACRTKCCAPYLQSWSYLPSQALLQQGVCVNSQPQLTSLAVVLSLACVVSR